MMRAEDKTRMTEGKHFQKNYFICEFRCFLEICFSNCITSADSLIVGNYLGSNALAAVSSSGNLIFLMVDLSMASQWVQCCNCQIFMGAKRQGKSGESDPHNGCIWNCSRNCIDSDRHSFSTKDPGADGNTRRSASGIYHLFPHLFCRLYRSDHVQYFCRDFAVGWRQQASADLSDHFFLYQCGAGYFLYFRIGDGSRCSRFGNSDFPIYKCILMSDPSFKSKRRI